MYVWLFFVLIHYNPPPPTKNQSCLLSSYQPGFSQGRYSNWSDSVHCSSSQKILSNSRTPIGHCRVFYWTSSTNVGHKWVQLVVLLFMPIHEVLRLAQFSKKFVHLYNPSNLSVGRDSTWNIAWIIALRLDSKGSKSAWGSSHFIMFAAVISSSCWSFCNHCHLLSFAGSQNQS